MAYLDWGDPAAARVVVCVHGLTRNAHDFDVLAQELASHGARVLAVDIVGRGRSSWLADPHGYAVPTYVAHLQAWLGGLGLARVDWIGTSMGGLVGMVLAAAETPPIERLVLNDIGPFVPYAALAEIQAYVGKNPRFASLIEAEAHLRTVHAPFGPLGDTEWQHLTRHSVVADAEGWRLHYDPAIAVPYAELAAEDLVLWELWDAVTRPTFVLHGRESTLLSDATCAEMARRGPKAEVAHIDGVGHAPALMAPDQIAIVQRWLQC